MKDGIVYKNKFVNKQDHDGKIHTVGTELATTGGRNHWKTRLITTSDVKLWTYFLSNYFFVFLRLLEKSELCNSLFEFRVSNRVFPFSLAHEFGSCAAKGAAWALG